MKFSLNLALKMLLNSILTLFLFVLIVQFAPMSITNLFLNPLAVVKGLQVEQEKAYKKEMENAEKGFKEGLKNKKSAIFDAKAPFFGAKDAKVEVVMFYDYKCGYCNALAKTVANIMKDEKYSKNVKFIARDFPILSPASAMLAVASLKAFEVAPEKFLEIHEALYEADGSEEGIVKKVLQITGKKIDLKNSSKEGKMLESNLNLGKELGIRGTPAMIIGEEFIGGLISEEELKAKLDVQLAK
jgi:protein-disulfide isomerase